MKPKYTVIPCKDGYLATSPDHPGIEVKHESPIWALSRLRDKIAKPVKAGGRKRKRRRKRT